VIVWKSPRRLQRNSLPHMFHHAARVMPFIHARPAGCEPVYFLVAVCFPIFQQSPLKLPTFAISSASPCGISSFPPRVVRNLLAERASRLFSLCHVPWTPFSPAAFPRFFAKSPSLRETFFEPKKNLSLKKIRSFTEVDHFFRHEYFPGLAYCV